MRLWFLKRTRHHQQWTLGAYPSVTLRCNTSPVSVGSCPISKLGTQSPVYPVSDLCFNKLLLLSDSLKLIFLAYNQGTVTHHQLVHILVNLFSSQVSDMQCDMPWRTGQQQRESSGSATWLEEETTPTLRASLLSTLSTTVSKLHELFDTLL